MDSELSKARMILRQLERLLICETEVWEGSSVYAIIEDNSILLWYDNYVWMFALSAMMQEHLGVRNMLRKLRGDTATSSILSLRNGRPVRLDDSVGIYGVRIGLALHPSYQIGTFPLVFSAGAEELRRESDDLEGVSLSKEGRYLKITKCNYLGQLYDDVVYAEQLSVDQ